MSDFTSLLSLSHILERVPKLTNTQNFEAIYTQLAGNGQYGSIRNELEQTVFDYFSGLQLPDQTTLYDHLVVSLRQKDVIATFNWDPFLILAARRNRAIAGKIPLMLFLHGNVMAGFCEKDRVHGLRGARCSRCGSLFTPSRLLYPVADKHYDRDPMISAAWEDLREALGTAFMVTVFGYSVPATDIAAASLLRAAWGPASSRPLEQFEIIDIKPEAELLDTWGDFIHTHHYEVTSDPYNSWMFKHPRRTGEAFINQFLEAKWIEDNPIPRELALEDLSLWLRPLLAAEEAAV
jgi:hypothetical protein